MMTRSDIWGRFEDFGIEFTSLYSFSNLIAISFNSFVKLTQTSLYSSIKVNVTSLQSFIKSILKSLFSFIKLWTLNLDQELSSKDWNQSLSSFLRGTWRQTVVLHPGNYKFLAIVHLIQQPLCHFTLSHKPFASYCIFLIHAASRCIFLLIFLSLFAQFFPVPCLSAPKAQKGIDTGKKSTRFWKRCIVGWNYTWAPQSTENRKWFCVRACSSPKSY